MNQKDFARGFIFKWEDGESADPKKTHSMAKSDAGNYQSGKYGVGPLVGSNHGVTAPALAKYRKVPVETITYEVMHDLKIDEAADIALLLYYKEPGLDKLAWNRVTASVFDFGWGAGQGTAIKHLQTLIKAGADGAVGPGTVAAYNNWLTGNGEIVSARMWGRNRLDYYAAVIRNKPRLGVNLHGWTARTEYFLPHGEGDWWNKWDSK